MSNCVTSRESILETCKQLVSEKGLSSLHMRVVAKACGVALGSLYYYFPSKNDLIIATIESVWEDIFKLNDKAVGEESFPDYIEKCYSYIQLGIQKYPNFFTIHSISVSTHGQMKARDSMGKYLDKIKEKMLNALKSDNISEDAFSDTFTEEDFVEFVLSNVVCLLVQKKNDCNVLLEVIRKTIY